MLTTPLFFPAILRFPKANKNISLLSSLSPAMAAPQPTQSVVVMRHGDRRDNADPAWLAAAARPWDPPLVEAGLTRARATGRGLRADSDFPIHRAFVSPFLRCVQTAAEAVTGLCADADPGVGVKVSVEFGLCEMLNSVAIRPPSAPKDGEFGFSVAEAEGLLPTGTVDRSVQPIYIELPKWPEEVAAARKRYVQIIKALADKYPKENLLLVTHGEGVAVAVSEFKKGANVYEVEYCAYAVLKRPVFHDRDEPASFGEFEVDRTKGVALESAMSD